MKDDMKDEITKWVDELIKWCYNNPVKVEVKHNKTDYAVEIPAMKYIEFDITTGPGQIVCFNFEDDSFDIFPDDCRHTITREQLIGYLYGLQERKEFHITEIEAWLMKQL